MAGTQQIISSSWRGVAPSSGLDQVTSIAGGDSLTWSTGNEQFYQYPQRSTGVYSLFCVNWPVAIDTGSMTISFRKNGADANSSVSLPPSTTGSITDSTNTDTVVAGDLISIGVTGTWTGSGALGGAAGEPGTISVIFTADTNTVARIGTSVNAGLTTGSTTTFRGIVDQGGFSSATEAPNCQNQFMHACTLQNFAINCTAKGRSKADTVTLRKNAVDTAITISVTGTGYLEDTTHTVAIVASDKVSISGTTGSGSGSDGFRNVSIETSSTDSSYHYFYANLAASSNTIFSGATVYMPLGGVLSSNGTEVPVSTEAQAAQTIQGLSVNVVANTVSAASTVTLRNNLADTALTLSIGSSSTGFFQDTTHSVSIADGDDVNYKAVMGGSGTDITIFSVSSYAIPLTQTAGEMVASAMFGFIQPFPFRTQIIAY